MLIYIIVIAILITIEILIIISSKQENSIILWMNKLILLEN